MKAEDVFCGVDGKVGELSHKLRTVTDLIRHIKTKEKNSPANYSIFLGAGASVTSGIKPAAALIDDWMIELYQRFEPTDPEENISLAQIRNYFETKHANWYRLEHPYSSLFEKKFDLPTQRRRFVEQEVDGKYPSIGYAYLTSLVDGNYFNTIFTTNFDDLVNEAFYLFSNKRPIVCAHDSSVHSVSITSKRPKIIKLHGDYLFDDIKSTLRETESLEQNTKEKFVEFCKEYGLIVVGYSGNDRSIMDVLEFLARQDNYLKNGVYWCIRRGDTVSHALKNLMWRDKVYPVLIDGFDEFFAEVHSLTVQEGLKISSSSKQTKLHNTIDEIVKDRHGLTKNNIIKSEIDRVRLDGDSKDISEFLKQVMTDGDTSRLGRRDFRNLLEIDALLEQSEYEHAQRLCEQHIESSKLQSDKRIYIEKYIDVLKVNGRDNQVAAWYEKLIDMDGNNVEYYLKKSMTIKDLNDRVSYLNGLLDRFQYSIGINNAIASACLRLIKNKELKSDDSLVSKAKEKLTRSFLIEPGLDNPAWIIKAELLEYVYINSDSHQDKDSAKLEFNELLEQAISRNPLHIRTLELIADRLNFHSDSSIELSEVVKELYKAQEKSSINKQDRLSSIISRCFEKAYGIEDNFESISMLKNFVEGLEAKETCSVPVSLCKLRYWLSFEPVEKSKQIQDELSFLLRRKQLGSDVGAILQLPIDFEEKTLVVLEKALEKDKHYLYKNYFYKTLSEIYAARSDYKKALEALEMGLNEGVEFSEFLITKTYLLLFMEDYDEVLKLYESNKELMNGSRYHAAMINVQYAAKKCGSNIFNKTILLNLTAQGEFCGVKMCAFSLLGNHQQAQNIMKIKLKSDPGLIYAYKKWPALSKESFVGV